MRTAYCNNISTFQHWLKAFTLAEVLLTLGIIGIVAVLTIPAQIQRYQEKVTINKVLSAYSLLNNAYSMLLSEYGTPDTWDDTSDIGLASMFAKKLNLGHICMTTDSKCHTSILTQYKTLTGYIKNGEMHLVGAAGQLKDMAVLFEMESPTCRGVHEYTWESVTEKSPYWHMCGYIKVDINGSKPPNRHGRDLFTFVLTDSKIIPKGTPPTPYYSLQSSCNPNITIWDGSTNGNFCAAWIIVNKNMDYLRKTVSW